MSDDGLACTGAGASEVAAREEQLSSEISRLGQVLTERMEFIEDVSHDLRGGLTFVRGYVDLLLDETLGPINEKQRKALEVVSRRTGSIIGLLDQMLTLERARAGHLERVNGVEVHELVQHCVQSAATMANEADVRLVVEAAPVQADGVDPQRLIQVLDNLISNAIKFSEPGGKVQVSLMGHEDSFEIVVADEGVGIAPEEQERIFERFYRAHATAEKATGSGLGLVIAKEIVEAHDGRIWVESALGKGSTFHVIIPR